MKLLLALLGVVACYRGTPSSSDSYTYRLPELRVGQRWNEVSSQVFEFEAIGGGERFPGSFTRSTSRMIEILELAGGVESRSRYTYLVDHERKAIRHDGPRDEEEAPTAIQGKSYVLSAGTPFQITDPEGNPVPAEEAAIIRERESRYGKPDRMQRSWVGKVLVVDRPVEATAAELASFRDPEDDSTFQRYVVTYRGRRDDRVELEITVQFTTPMLTAKLTGKTIIDATTGMELESDLAGLVTFDGNGEGEGVLRGRMRLSQQRTL